jgi:hypothetical protein
VSDGQQPPGPKTLTVRKPWDEAARARYEYIAAEGVAVHGGQPLNFLTTLPRLRRVLVFDRTLDDSPVYDCPDLEDVVLFDSCATALQADRWPRLRRLQLDSRPGLESLRDHPTLQVLGVHGFRGHDIEWLGRPPALTSLVLAGRRQAFDVTSLRTVAEGLDTLTLDKMTFTQADLPDLPRLVNRLLQPTKPRRV